MTRFWLVLAVAGASVVYAGPRAWDDNDEIAMQRAERARDEAERRAEEAERQAEKAERAAERVERAYERGARALDRRQYEEAARAFAEFPKNAARADGALYWKAYAENKLGRRADALATLAALQKDFPQSRWLTDAKALEIEVKQAQGQPVRPETQDDEELKLMAINSLMNADPERAIPQLEKVLTGSSSIQLKERALFVLAQSGSPRARQAIVDLAKGKGNPDLQRKAISNLGLFGGKESRAALVEIYQANPDPAVKQQVLDAYFLAGDTARIAELARSEKDPALRRQAITKLGLMGKRTASELSSLYAGSDKGSKEAVLNAFFLQNNAPALIEIARKESDPQLKNEAVSKLSLMRSKEATDFMMEILNK